MDDYPWLFPILGLFQTFLKCCHVSYGPMSCQLRWVGRSFCLKNCVNCIRKKKQLLFPLVKWINCSNIYFLLLCCFPIQRVLYLILSHYFVAFSVSCQLRKCNSKFHQIGNVCVGDFLFLRTIHVSTVANKVNFEDIQFCLARIQFCLSESGLQMSCQLRWTAPVFIPTRMNSKMPLCTTLSKRTTRKLWMFC